MRCDGIERDLGDALFRAKGEATIQRFEERAQAEKWIRTGERPMPITRPAVTTSHESRRRRAATLRPAIYFAVRGSYNDGVETEIDLAIMRMSSKSEMMDFKTEEEAIKWINEIKGMPTEEQQRRYRRVVWESEQRKVRAQTKINLLAKAPKRRRQTKGQRPREPTTASQKKPERKRGELMTNQRTSSGKQRRHQRARKRPLAASLQKRYK